MPDVNGKYDELDQEIIRKIGIGKVNRLGRILEDGLLRMARAIMAKKIPIMDPRHVDADWRLIDRRLQALRRAGKLTYSRKKGWKAP